MAFRSRYPFPSYNEDDGTTGLMTVLDLVIQRELPVEVGFLS